MTISSVGLNDVAFYRLLRTTSSLTTVVRSAVNYLAARASDSASRARDVILFSARKAMLGLLLIEITPLGPGILSFIYS